MTPPCIHGLTIRKSSKPINARVIEIPLSHRDQHHFPKGAKVVLALESDSTVQVRSEVWGVARRYVIVRRKEENSNRFLIGADVMLLPDTEARNCDKCSRAYSPAGTQCFTMARGIKKHVSLEQTAYECKRYKEVE